MAIARYYAPYNQEDPTKPTFVFGVPLGDIEEEEWEALPEWAQTTADASGLYLKTKPPAAKVKAAEEAALPAPKED